MLFFIVRRCSSLKLLNNIKVGPPRNFQNLEVLKKNEKDKKIKKKQASFWKLYTEKPEELDLDIRVQIKFVCYISDVRLMNEISQSVNFSQSYLLLGSSNFVYPTKIVLQLKGYKH